MADVVVVESPAKAKTIEKYLGDQYTVVPSYGHVRDLEERDGAVLPERNFEMVWGRDPKGEQQVERIAAALRRAKRLYLATDPDREGEAISWHVKEMLESRGALAGKEVARITFNEITRRAVQAALAHPRDLDRQLIEAYLARRALDYLVGYTLSPLLWRKLPGSRSAGRVQSVALRLICEREAEIEAFRPREYWRIEGRFFTPADMPFTARLTHLEGRRLERFDLPDRATAERAKALAEAARYRVVAVEKRRTRRHPPPPFITSTLQMEASRKLGFSAQQTMRLAQTLYEAGHITYMRTDGVNMAEEAVHAIRSYIAQAFGEDYRPPSPRLYQSRVKNAQEAHEAIRPTDITRTAEAMAHELEAREAQLYELIWKRAVAAQMAAAEIDQTIVEIVSEDEKIRFRATGSVVIFDGFLKLYREDEDERAADLRAGIRPTEPTEKEEDGLLPPMAEGDRLRCEKIEASQHFTQPPPRYTEATLVKRLEELGIGRPSTYATILQRLQELGYVRLENRRFIAQDLGRMVTTFLVRFFEKYVDTGFTSQMEEKLDEISAGQVEWRAVMRAFWEEFSRAVEATKQLSIRDVIDALDEDLGPHLFPPRKDGSDPRRCPGCGTGRLGLKLGRSGAFIGCSHYPHCRYTRPFGIDPGQTDMAVGERVLGRDPASGQTVSLKRGPFGFYIQLGDAESTPSAKAAKPKRISLPPSLAPEMVTLEQALGLLSLPRVVGIDPESGEDITVGIGRFGPYVRCGAIYRSLERDDDPLTLGMNRALSLLAEARAKLRELGPHPDDGVPIVVRKGRFGPYVQHGQRVANLPRDVAIETVTLAQAVALLAEKGKPLKARRAAPKKATTPAGSAPAAEPPPPSATPGPTRRSRRTPAATAKPTSRRRPAAAPKTRRRRGGND